MRNSLLFFAICMLYFPSIIFAQSLEFTEVKTIGDNKTVYFHIKGLDDDEAARSELLEQLLSDENVKGARIFTSSSLKTRCQLYLPLNITPEYIRPILINNGYDFDFSTVSIDGKMVNEIDKSESYVSQFNSPAEGFPTLIYTGDKEGDYEQYRISKEQWIAENQKKYEKQRNNGTATYPIVISKSDFNKFTDEKKQKILAEPDKYVIK